MDKDKRNLVIVESPNKVKSLTKIFKDAGYKNTLVLACVGHITEIKDGGDYWNTGIEPTQDFKTTYAISKDKKEVVSKLTAQVKSADRVYLCSDPDREGEAIAWALKKFLKIPESKYDRVTFHEITPKAVLKAFDSPRKIDEDLVDAAQARQILDKLTGYRLSPEARKAIGAKSVGRCQSAGLKLIVDRELEILNFVPEIYYDLFLHFNKNGTEFKAKYVGTVNEEVKRIPDLATVEQISQDCHKNMPFVVSNIEQKERLSNPKPPFTTSTFQQEVANKLGVSIKTSMSYAQRLFEGLDVNGEHIALITYIRTDSTELAPEFIPELEKHVLDNYGKKYYAGVKKAKKNDLAQDGHEAIRPVNMEMTPEKLSQYIKDEVLLKIYDIIYRRTEACAMSPSITSETVYQLKNGEHLFNLVSKELIFDGYKKAYNYKEDNEEKEELVKETFALDEVIDRNNACELEYLKKSTTPPARYKEATFVKDLEAKGIGRPSTFATIVETILSPTRGYCTVEDKCIVPTKLGMTLVKFLGENFHDLFEISYTADMEKDLDLIANGKLEKLVFLKSFYDNLEAAATKVSPEDNAKRVCPQCGKPLKKRKGPYGFFWGCSGYPDCKYIEKK